MCLRAQLVVPREEKKNKRREVKERNIERKEGKKEKCGREGRGRYKRETDRIGG